MTLHFCVSVPTFDWPMTFSVGLKPVWPGPKRNCGQSVLTVNGALATRPVCKPKASK